MSTDEPTKDLKDPAEYETKPVMELVLERVTAIGDELTGFRQQTNAGLEAVETTLKEFQDETRMEFRKLNKKLDVFNSELLVMKADMSLLEDRVEELERKAS